MNVYKTEQRPDPQAVLDKINQDSTQKNKGKLKIFFGYSAGVGKTYAMLQEAHALHANGLDVVIGYVEPHQRPDTLALFEGLPKIPLLEIQHKGITLYEFNIDSALARLPKVILVDELAHTNATGCRHVKRYQDIEELLRSGIDVYTTVNAQHLEGLHDIVESITGVAVRERIPDYVFDSADKVELVDIEPEDLIARMNKGKVYKPEQAQRALSNFFTKEKLVALREISLRRTADRVSIIVEKNKNFEGSSHYVTGEHIMMCLSSSPSNGKVIRTAAKMADAFHGKFTALFVENAGHADMQKTDQERLRKNLRLAEHLGAKVVTVYGDDVPYQMAEYAKAGGVSKLVLGRPARAHFLGFSPQNYVDKLTEYAPNLEVYVIPNTLSTKFIAFNKYKGKMTDWSVSINDIGKMLLGLAVASAIGLVFAHWGISEANIIVVYILATLLIAVGTESKLCSLLSSASAVMLFNFFFTEPFYSLDTYESGHFVTFVIMFFASFTVSSFTKKFKEQAKYSASKAHRMEVLLATSQKLQLTRNKREVFLEIINQINELIGKKVFLYPVIGNTLGDMICSTADHEELQKYSTYEELAVAKWVMVNNKHAGATTDTLTMSKCLYMSIRSGSKIFAVVGIAMDEERFLETFEKSLLVAMLAECALALEKENLSDD